MGSGRGDRNQRYALRLAGDPAGASMGSGRGDRNQLLLLGACGTGKTQLQWGPVVVTGIRGTRPRVLRLAVRQLQWGPVVVTGIRVAAAVGTWYDFTLQWGPVVVTGIRSAPCTTT